MRDASCLHGHLFNPLDQGILVKGHSFSTLVEVVLVSDAELQNLSGVQPFQIHAAGRRLAAQHSWGEAEPTAQDRIIIVINVAQDVAQVTLIF